MSMTPESELGQRIAQSGVIAVLVIDRAEDAVPVTHALLEGGISVMELTLRTDAAIPCAKRNSSTGTRNARRNRYHPDHRTSLRSL